MDKEFKEFSADKIVVTGVGASLSKGLYRYLKGDEINLSDQSLNHDCMPTDFLLQRKTIKFMSKQDRLAVEAAGNAIQESGLTPEILGSDTGVFMTVGYIPFEFDIAEKLATDSTVDNAFSMRDFTSAAIEKLNPLLAFTCLPNMPAHHIAMNNQILGPYFITYPDIIQFAVTMQEAITRVQEGSIRCALVGAVADQNNFLVNHHYQKQTQKPNISTSDSSAFLILETETSARKRGANILFQLESLVISESQDNTESPPNQNSLLGPVEMALELYFFKENLNVTTHMQSYSNATAEVNSTWKKET